MPLQDARKVTHHTRLNPTQFVEVFALDEPNRGGAHTAYKLFAGVGADAYEISIKFQDGHPDAVGYNGILDDALIAVVIDRLQGFQSGPFASRETAIVITKLQEALQWSAQRVADRLERGVMNTDSK